VALSLNEPTGDIKKLNKTINAKTSTKLDVRGSINITAIATTSPNPMINL
jgi:hypothetical protein